MNTNCKSMPNSKMHTTENLQTLSRHPGKMSGNGPGSAWSQLVSSCSFCDCIAHSRSGVIARRKGEGREGGEGRRGKGGGESQRGDGRGREGKRKGEKKEMEGRKTEGA